MLKLGELAEQSVCKNKFTGDTSSMAITDLGPFGIGVVDTKDSTLVYGLNQFTLLQLLTMNVDTSTFYTDPLPPAFTDDHRMKKNEILKHIIKEYFE